MTHYEPDSEREPWLRIAHAHAMLMSVSSDDDGVPVLDDYAGLFSALDYALRGDPGCVEPDEWVAERETALVEHAEYLAAPVHREEGEG